MHYHSMIYSTLITQRSASCSAHQTYHEQCLLDILSTCPQTRSRTMMSSSNYEHFFSRQLFHIEPSRLQRNSRNFIEVRVCQQSQQIYNIIQSITFVNHKQLFRCLLGKTYEVLCKYRKFEMKINNCFFTAALPPYSALSD